MQFTKSFDFVRKENRLSFGARILFEEIFNLTQYKGYCWASNRYFANTFGVSISTIKKYLDELEKIGLIVRRQILGEERHIYLNDPALSRITDLPQSKFKPSPADISTTPSQNFDLHPVEISSTNYKTDTNKLIQTNLSIRKSERLNIQYTNYVDILKDADHWDYEGALRGNCSAQQLEIIDGWIKIAAEEIVSEKEYLTISGCSLPRETVRETLLALDYNHILYILQNLQKANNIQNPRNYILKALLTAPKTMALVDDILCKNLCTSIASTDEKQDEDGLLNFTIEELFRVPVKKSI